MVIFTQPNYSALAIARGMLSASLNTAIEDFLDVSFDKETLFKCFLASFTYGLLLGVIYYAFAVYGFTKATSTPTQIIVAFTLYFGLANLMSSMVLRLFYAKLFPRHDV